MATLPSGSDGEITFISGVDASYKVASKAYWGWKFDAPATYNTTQTRASKWGSTTLQPSGTPANITYFFDTQNNSNWTQAEQNALLAGLHLWAAEANITFSVASSQQSANIVFVRGTNNGAANTSPQSLGAAVGTSTTGAATQKTITIDTTPINTPAPGTAGFGPIGDPSQAISYASGGGRAYETILHEEGHALGLGHGGPYNQGDGLGSVQSRQFSIYDNLQYSLMSYINPMDPTAKYFSNPNYSAAGTKWGTAPSTGFGGVGLPDPTNPNILYAGNPNTPMILDILAIQRIYGAPIGGPLYSGGQVFGFNSNIAGDVGDYFNFTINQNPILTIWDGGFGNTLDLSGYSTASTIKLAPGSFTSADGMTNNIGIAEDTWIDTAIGSQGINKITGNDHSNTLTGGPLGDTLSGGGGDDTLRGGGGGDKLDGGAGINNTATYDTAPSSVVANTLFGGANNDIIKGGGGNDTLDGGDDNDTVDYSDKTLSVNVTLNGSTPTTVTVGGHAEDTISSFENIIGGSAGDMLTGDGGANTIDGRGGADTMIGLGGNDTYVVDNAKDIVTEAVGGGSDTVNTSVSYTLGAGQEIEFLNSSLNLKPNAPGLTLTGNDFAQTITGDAGADTIDGKGGADTMTGLGGNDTYYVDNPNDVVNEAINGGALDRVFTSFSYTLGNGQEMSCSRRCRVSSSRLSSTPALLPIAPMSVSSTTPTPAR
jgi:serralysin